VRRFSKLGLKQSACSVLVIVGGIACASNVMKYGTYPGTPQDPAEITVPYDAMNHIDFGELKDRLRPYRGGKPPHDTHRPCKNVPSCTVTVSVEEVGKSWDIDPNHDASHPVPFRVIGVWTNTDPTNTEARYGLQPKTTYYVWVRDATPSSTPEVKNSTVIWGILQEGSSTLVAEGYVMRCHPDSYGNQTSNLDFKYCPYSPTNNVASGSAPSTFDKKSVFAFVSRMFEKSRVSMVTAETWFECDPGCCTGTTATQ
jgi:hypothetical protein